MIIDHNIDWLRGRTVLPQPRPWPHLADGRTQRRKGPTWGNAKHAKPRVMRMMDTWMCLNVLEFIPVRIRTQSPCCNMLQYIKDQVFQTNSAMKNSWNPMNIPGKVTISAAQNSYFCWQPTSDGSSEEAIEPPPAEEPAVLFRRQCGAPHCQP